MLGTTSLRLRAPAPTAWSLGRTSFCPSLAPTALDRRGRPQGGDSEEMRGPPVSKYHHSPVGRHDESRDNRGDYERRRDQKPPRGGVSVGSRFQGPHVHFPSENPWGNGSVPNFNLQTQ